MYGLSMDEQGVYVNFKNYSCTGKFSYNEYVYVKKQYVIKHSKQNLYLIPTQNKILINLHCVVKSALCLLYSYSTIKSSLSKQLLPVLTAITVHYCIITLTQWGHI